MAVPGENNNVAVLVGNGLSIAFNPDLNLQTITEEVVRRIEQADGGDVIAAMKELANRALPRGVTSESDFEQLVGAFGSETRSLGNLETLASLTSPQDVELLEAIRKTASFADQVRDNGISHVLQVICERSRAYADDADNLHQLIRSVIEAFDGKVVIGNLNYDTLLLAALLWVCDSRDIADLGHGYKKVSVVINDDTTARVPALRETKSDFPSNRRIRLLHLHGSLTYWQAREHNIFAKISKEMLDDGSQWQAVRDRTTNVRPAVVLASPRDKSDHVNEYPFNLAYEVFAEGLGQSNHWIVIGYSFRDDPVNAKLRAEFLGRYEKPAVLVVTYGDSPTRVEVERAFGWGADDPDSTAWLTINRDGANGVQDTSEWGDFVTA